MSESYIGEIRIFGGTFAPSGWAFCNGQTIAIADNSTLFALIGTTYGGDGQTNFNLPNLQSRVPVHMGSGFNIGQLAGEESVTLNLQQIPAHSHVVQASQSASTANPTNAVFGGGPTWFESNNAPTLQMNGAMVGSSSGNQAHDNMVPYLVVNFIISLFGIFPSRS